MMMMMMMMMMITIIIIKRRGYTSGQTRQVLRHELLGVWEGGEGGSLGACSHKKKITSTAML